jgi:hypothetical protein
MTRREYFLDEGYGYFAITSFLERGHQKKKMVALKEGKTFRGEACSSHVVEARVLHRMILVLFFCSS